MGLAIAKGLTAPVLTRLLVDATSKEGHPFRHRCRPQLYPAASSIMHPPFRKRGLDERHDQHDAKEHVGDGRCVAHPEKLEGVLVDHHDEGIGGVGRSPGRQDGRDIKDLKGVDHRGDGDKKRAGRDQRKRNVPKLLPAAGPVDTGALCKAPRERLSARPKK